MSVDKKETPTEPQGKVPSVLGDNLPRATWLAFLHSNWLPGLFGLHRATHTSVQLRTNLSAHEFYFLSSH